MLVLFGVIQSFLHGLRTEWGCWICGVQTAGAAWPEAYRASYPCQKQA